MLETRETLRHDFPEQIVVINAKDVQRAIPFGLWLRAPIGSIVNLSATGMTLRLVRYGSYIHVKSCFVDS
jgi:hypothetical protein